MGEATPLRRVWRPPEGWVVKREPLTFESFFEDEKGDDRLLRACMRSLEAAGMGRIQQVTGGQQIAPC
jgi:hypothetical protein